MDLAAARNLRAAVFISDKIRLVLTTLRAGIRGFVFYQYLHGCVQDALIVH